jgi:fructose-1,6-bisphosphatase/sedoheptulose 1,7-bisphosphatase-like protein
MYVVKSKVKALAKTKGKRVSKSYFLYLERKIHDIVMHHISIMGSRVTLNIEDAEALDAFRMTRS